MQNELMFPILNDTMIKCIPWAAIAPHEAQAQRNHSQTLRGLAGRGGLSIHEAYHIMKNQEWPWRTFKRSAENDAQYRVSLMALVRDFEKARAAQSTTEAQKDD
jgi:hypothetical protein